MNGRANATLVAVALGVGACAERFPSETRVQSAGELGWAPVVKADGTPTPLRSVDLWGSAKEGPHGTLTTFPGGAAEPLHRHSRPFNVLVVAGTVRYTIDGRPSDALETGSYVTIARRVPHFARCVSTTACVVYVEQDGPLDVEMVPE